MKCIFCNSLDSKVVDSRSVDDDTKIRRRRECLTCGRRFTSYEIAETAPMLVIKNDGTRQPYNSAKIKAGILKACEKRQVSMSEIDAMVKNVEQQVFSTLDDEIPSTKIGEMVMRELKNADSVAYIRFASVYRQFRDVTNFIDFIAGEKDKQ